MANTRITISEKRLKHVEPVSDLLWLNRGIIHYWEDLTNRNGGRLENLRRAHRELQELLTRAVSESKEKHIPLDDIEVVCPQLMEQSAWGGYFGRPWDPDCRAATLQQWFTEQFGDAYKFYVNAQPKLGDRAIYTRVLIDFSKSDVKKYDFVFRA